MLLALVLGISLAVSLGVCALGGAFAGLAWLWVLPVSFAGSFLGLALVLFLAMWIAAGLVDMDKPQQKDDPLYRAMVEMYLQALLPLLRVHVHTQGMEKAPKEGRYMLVCNHNNNGDPLVLLHCFRGDQLAFVAKREVKEMFLVGKLLHRLQGQFINRENDREALKTILSCIRILKEDTGSVAVFPEGGINPDMKLHHFRSGVFKIAQKAQVPIVVCTMRNTEHLIRNVLQLRRSDVELHLVEVIPAEELAGAPTTQIAERVYELMAGDLGPELVAGE